MSNDSLGDRMKSYEDAYRMHLPIRMPVILRVDGKAFHTYTKGCKKPVDQGLVDCMNDTAIALCKNIQGAQIAYVQSDEISILLNNYKTIDTQAWFENNVQKMVSISASIASVTFTENSYKIWGFHDNAEGTGFEGMGYTSPIIKPAYFDSRVFEENFMTQRGKSTGSRSPDLLLFLSRFSILMLLLYTYPVMSEGLLCAK